MTTPDFILRGVGHAYRSGGAALSGIDLTVEAGQHVAVVGANGSGKSTLLKMLDGLVFPMEGEVLAFGAPLTEEALEDPAFRRDFRARVGFVFQDADVQLFCASVLDELAFGPLQLGLAEDEVRRRVHDVAEHLRIEKLLDRPPYSLSGGEKKRVAIASIDHHGAASRCSSTSRPTPSTRAARCGCSTCSTSGSARDAPWSWRRTTSRPRRRQPIASSSSPKTHAVATDGTPEEVLTQHELLLSVNLIHEHTHRHASTAHRHAHAHGPGADPDEAHGHRHG